MAQPPIDTHKQTARVAKTVALQKEYDVLQATKGTRDFVCYNYPMSIRVLPPEVASKIAAGEVVERPANVAKELMENSIDAGATEIRVEIREGGRRLLRVTDNGQGILAAEAPLAFERHATSKLRAAEDLEHIATFGFRGEALYSIAAVSQLTLTTRHRSEEFGVTLRVEGGKLGSQSRAGAPVGTVVNVEHLFYNVPARQKFLKPAATEAGQIAAVVQRFALAYPGPSPQLRQRRPAALSVCRHRRPV